MATTNPPVDAGLRHGVMSGPELAAQAIANIAPSAVIAFTAAAIYLSAGTGTILSFALATVVILSVGYCVVVFARRNASAGSLYTYVSKGLGPFGAYLAGVALLVGCWGIAAGSLGGAISYTSDFLVSLGIPAGGTVATIVLAVVLGGLATLFTIRGIRLSARVSLTLELMSVTIIMILLVLALVWAGPAAWDPSQFSLSDVPGQGVAAGMVLGILGFVGFSSADALGREARNPYTAIPRAIMWSALVVGVLYVFAAYTQIAVLQEGLADSANPLQDIATLIGMPTWFNPILLFGVGASFFAVVVAPLNVVGRIGYVMGKEGVVADRFGRTHDGHLTPHRVLLIAGPAAIILDIILLAAGVHPMDIVVWVDTYATYGYMIAYSLVAAACVVYTRRAGLPNRLVWITAVIAILAMAYTFFANVYPVPTFPLNILPYLFLATIAVALGWYYHLVRNRPEVIARIGQTETDTLEGVG
ncbi:MULTISPECIES: APC family permease [Mycobacteriaceae]|uniref:Amino acid permease n=1 Tax=Mycolicibacterium neoaurum VKM Ac-1815D TaxID=700508 RepID=V5XIM9_MYCNE|nr:MULTISPECIES: APC family permease [Mycobacteriaceae]AHC27304.1 amino acid permease [Mycolicibacterium neoaurum VKM Ac-1815D]AMO07535.1 amino acid permease [Mycolicibacterium neoaurum]AXK74075.1 amino acid permease [Mycolicibacterium neoaurum]KJQ51489.1 amino acid permease [Mycolicibacterium neoaurum]KUM08935.1 amino acid permease [Mycolicibacterium neoaurum]